MASFIAIIASFIFTSDASVRSLDGMQISDPKALKAANARAAAALLALTVIHNLKVADNSVHHQVSIKIHPTLL